MTELDKKDLTTLFIYEPSTGKLYWRNSGRKSVQGKECGYISRGYRLVQVNGKNIPAHRIIWALETGSFPADTIDHINGDKSDNRISNLRCVPQAENNKNRPLYRSNKSGVCGVGLVNGKYVAQIRKGGKNRQIGTFNNLFDAACARKSAELSSGYHANHGR